LDHHRRAICRILQNAYIKVYEQRIKSVVMDYNMLFLQPSTLDGIAGNAAAVDALRRFAKSFNAGERPKPMMLFGPPGTGKSAAVYAMASEADWKIVELSASDYRDSGTIARVLAPAAMSRNIFGRRNLILLDEIDELASRFDSGAAGALSKLIETSRSPMVFVANDFWDRRIQFLRALVEPVQFRRVETRLVAELLAAAAARGRIKVDRDALSAIAQRANGDVRSALNDLFAFIDSEGRDDIMYSIGQRDVKKDVFQTLDKIFYSNTLVAPLVAAANCDVDKDMLMRWIEENLARRYKNREDISGAFESLSRASTFSTRATASQQYGLWRYMNVMLSSGVALAKSGYPSSSERYAFPKVITDLSKAKARKEREIEIAAKLQRRVHGSIREIRFGAMQLIGGMVRGAGKEESAGAYEFMQAAYGLDKKDVDFLKELQ
jgi:replication factor C large subunit